MLLIIMLIRNLIKKNEDNLVKIVYIFFHGSCNHNFKNKKIQNKTSDLKY